LTCWSAWGGFRGDYSSHECTDLQSHSGKGGGSQVTLVSGWLGQPGEKMDVPLRMMLTASQDELIRKAAGGDVSGWARPILLEAAKGPIEEAKKRPRK